MGIFSTGCYSSCRAVLAHLPRFYIASCHITRLPHCTIVLTNLYWCSRHIVALAILVFFLQLTDYQMGAMSPVKLPHIVYTCHTFATLGRLQCAAYHICLSSNTLKSFVFENHICASLPTSLPTSLAPFLMIILLNEASELLMENWCSCGEPLFA